VKRRPPTRPDAGVSIGVDPNPPDANPTLLHEWFVAAARRWIVTYAKLDRLSDAVAAVLRESVAGECVVEVLLPRTSERLYVAQLGVLKAGAAHACIDPPFPDDQIAHNVKDVGLVALITDGAGEARIRAAGILVEQVISFDRTRLPAHPMFLGEFAPPPSSTSCRSRRW